MDHLSTCTRQQDRHTVCTCEYRVYDLQIELRTTSMHVQWSVQIHIGCVLKEFTLWSIGKSPGQNIIIDLL